MLTGDSLRDSILLIVGNIFIIIFAVRAVSQFMNREWGDMLTSVLVAVFVAGIIWFPDQVISFLKAAWQGL